MDASSQRRQLLFGTTPHRRPTGSSSSLTASLRPVAQHHATEQEAIEAANDAQVDSLCGQVGQMKHLALDLGQEVRDQNDMLTDMTGSFDRVGDSVRKSIALVRRLASSGGGIHLCILFCFAFLFFLLVYLFLR